MWSSWDNICVEVTEEFYKQLTIRPWNETSNRGVALALHKSILNVRSLRRLCVGTVVSETALSSRSHRNFFQSKAMDNSRSRFPNLQ
jgi:hypothetical protein